jgi:hypothetical protein
VTRTAKIDGLEKDNPAIGSYNIKIPQGLHYNFVITMYRAQRPGWTPGWNEFIIECMTDGIKKHEKLANITLNQAEQKPRTLDAADLIQLKQIKKTLTYELRRQEEIANNVHTKLSRVYDRKTGCCKEFWVVDPNDKTPYNMDIVKMKEKSLLKVVAQATRIHQRTSGQDQELEELLQKALKYA